MLYDRINLLQGADIQNLVVASGVSFPSSPDLGELFFRTDQDKLYVYKSGGWAESGAAFDSSANQTVTGTWTFSQPIVGATPTASNQLTTKSYVDSATDTSANKSITGSWSFSQPVAGATPTGPTHLATKSYVDTAVANAGSGSVSSVNVSGGTTGLTTSGGPITSSGTITLGGVLALANGGTGGTTQASALNNLLPSQGAAAGKVLSSNGTNAVWDAVPAKGDTVGQIQIRDNNGYMTNSLSTMDSSGMTLHSGTSTSTYTAEAGNNVRLLGLDVEVGLVAAGTTGVAKIQSPTDIKFVAGNIERLNINSSGALGFQSVYGTAGQVLTSQGTGAVPTWTTISSAASALTGTTLASNVVTSSLTAVGTITTGTWSGSFGAVSGANLTNLNASNLASGTVGTARLGSGTANNTTYLRGDGTWATVTAGSVSSLQGTGAYGLASTTGAYVGTASDSGTTIPIMAFAQSDAAVDAKYWRVSARNGIFRIGGINDALSAFSEYFTITRNGSTASLITATATGINLAIGTGGLQLSGSAGTSGQVLTSQGSSAAPIWAAPTVTSIFGTGSVAGYSATTSAVNVGNQGIFIVNGGATANNRVYSETVTTGGQYNLSLVSDGGTAAGVFTINRSGNTASSITLTGTAINLTGAVTGTSFSGPLTGALVGSSNQAVGVASTATIAGVLSGAASGTFNGRATLALVSSSATAGNRVWGRQVDGSGNLYEYLFDDTQSAGTAWLQVARSANTASTITLTGTTLALAATTTTTAASSSLDFGGRYTELNTPVTATATTNFNCSLGNIFTVTMSASITSLTFTNIPASGRAYNMTLILAQDATGGRSITWPASVKWPNGTVPTLSAANKVDIITLMTTNGGTTWYGLVAGQNF